MLWRTGGDLNAIGVAPPVSQPEVSMEAAPPHPVDRPLGTLVVPSSSQQISDPLVRQEPADTEQRALLSPSVSYFDRVFFGRRTPSRIVRVPCRATPCEHFNPPCGVRHFIPPRSSERSRVSIDRSWTPLAKKSPWLFRFLDCVDNVLSWDIFFFFIFLFLVIACVIDSDLALYDWPRPDDHPHWWTALIYPDPRSTTRWTVSWKKFVSNRCIRNWRENRNNESDRMLRQTIEKYAAERINERR